MPNQSEVPAPCLVCKEQSVTIEVLQAMVEMLEKQLATEKTVLQAVCRGYLHVARELAEARLADVVISTRTAKP